MIQLIKTLNIIKNGYQAKKNTVIVPASRFVEQVLKLLVQEGYLEKIKRITKTGQQYLKIKLKYCNERPAVREIVLVSKPGRKIFQKNKDIKPFKPLAGHRQEVGRVIISSSEGVMTTINARKKGLGGQILFKIL